MLRTEESRGAFYLRSSQFVNSLAAHPVTSRRIRRYGPIRSCGSSQDPFNPNPAGRLSRKECHSGANGALLSLFPARSAAWDPAPPAPSPSRGSGSDGAMSRRQHRKSRTCLPSNSPTPSSWRSGYRSTRVSLPIGWTVLPSLCAPAQIPLNKVAIQAQALPGSDRRLSVARSCAHAGEDGFGDFRCGAVGIGSNGAHVDLAEHVGVATILRLWPIKEVGIPECG
jgi:hypothetical protein